jgi:Leucine-rich repeat (LRR) protein
MNKLLLLLLFIPIIGFSQYTSIPDQLFEKELIRQGYDKKTDGKIKTKNIKDVTSLQLTVAWFEEDTDNITGIEDLTGIEDFTSLTRLEIIGEDDMGSVLTVLDLSKNIALKKLRFDNHYSGLVETLDLSKNTALEVLSCSESGLKKLDVSQNTLLTDLNCSGNKFRPKPKYIIN